MKILLPTAAAALILLVIVWPDLTGHVSRFRITMSETEALGPATTQRLIEPRFTGADTANRPYNLTAETAATAVDDDSLVTLERPKADITLGDGSWVALIAETGMFLREEEVLHLSGGVDLFHDRGYQFRTASAVIDLRNRTAFGSDPVEAMGPFGRLEAAGFQVLDDARRVVFTGKARLVLDPDLVRNFAE